MVLEGLPTGVGSAENQLYVHVFNSVDEQWPFKAAEFLTCMMAWSLLEVVTGVLKSMLESGNGL